MASSSPVPRLSVHSRPEQLQALLRLAETVGNHPDAHHQFQAWVADLRVNEPEVAALMEQLWQAYVASQRSAHFWQQRTQMEQRLSNRLSQHHAQLQQNYLRLVQEQ